MSKEIFKMEGITKIYTNGFMANKDVTFAVNEGEIHALLGENGAGKTTLMKILFGLEDCQEGAIYINGEQTKIINPLDAIAKGVGMVHQHFMQVDNLSVAENIVLGIEPGKGPLFDKAEAVRMTQEAAEKFQLDVDPNALIRDIGVGTKQKVELLKALIKGIKILILDEPTAVLTPQETKELFVQLKHLRSQGYGIVFISHKLEEVIELCDRCTILRHGKVTGAGDIKDLDEEKISKMMVGRDVILTIDKEPAQPKEKILEIRDLNYIDDIGKRLVNDLSFGIRAGEVVGIAGVEGNGQNELSENLNGLMKSTSGKITLNDKNITNIPIRKIREAGIAHISEDRMTYGCAANLSVLENIQSIYLDHPDFTKGPFIDKKKVNEFVDKCIVDFEISCDNKNDAIRLLSGGNIQKCIVAREFLSGANLIVANQPTRGIDVGTAELIRKLLVKYTRENNMGVLLISSDLNEILEVSDRLLVMRKGKVAAQINDPKAITDVQLGEYMLGVNSMTSEEMGDLF